ncbi:MAG: hypothetical protein Q4C96_03755 [Planctomycetia bacterium]|nr:hypothetical protein [Planctomycetia bacterium]
MRIFIFLFSLFTIFLSANSPVFADNAALMPNQQVTIQETTWTAEIPDPQKAKISQNAGTVTFSALKNTDMWNQRNAAPILKTKTPEGNFAIQACVEMDSTKVAAVTGITVYSGKSSAVPAFTFGLDHWNASQKVKFQGLPPSPNNPEKQISTPGTLKVYLRLECYRKTLTNRRTDMYIVYYKPEECRPWTEVSRFFSNVPNDYAALFLKTSSAQNATFKDIQLIPLADNLEMVEKIIPVASLTDIPSLKGKKLLFVARLQYKNDHHNTATMFQNDEINTGSFTGGSALRYIDYADNGKVITLLESPDGVIRDPEISWDGKRILFSMRKNRDDDYHIYEMEWETRKITQLTFGRALSDIDPAYLPDGRIVFSSTREPKFCMCNRHIMCNLYTMDADGANIHQIGHSTLFEGHSSILPDGRILYDRWEYVDRNFGDAQGLWVTNPDGTNHALYFGNNTGAPGGILDARPIPGTNLICCTFSSCHDRPWGAIAVIDRSKSIEGPDGVLHIFPESSRSLIKIKGHYDAFKRVSPKYEDPFPFSDSEILCSRQIIGQGEKTAICYLSFDGRQQELYAEPEDSPYGCFDPMIIQPHHQIPRVIQSRIDLTKKTGVFYVSDVYNGSGMDEIPRGTAKWLRVVESPEKRFWTRGAWSTTGEQAPAMAWDDFNNKRILGTVPIEEDGSASFEVPADTFLYFQILDEEGRMIQSMRSGTIVRPGETQGCIGCHDDRLNAVAPRHTVKALLRQPNQLKSWYGPSRLFSYTSEIQPIFDKHCLKCHDVDGPGAKKICLAGDKNIVFNNSYFELRKNKNFVKVVGAGPAEVQMPRTWGSYVSPLAKIVLYGHGVPERDAKLNLSPEEKDRIITWIDINAPYYSDYSTSMPKNRYGRSPLNSGQTIRLSQLTGIDLNKQGNANQVWFDRVELSPCLKKLNKNTPEYKEALEIITAGKTALQNAPRNDMPGFQLIVPSEQNAQQKYQERLKEEEYRIQKIIQGEKVYDPKE